MKIKKQFKVKLKTEEVQEFVNAITPFDCSFDMGVGRRMVDGKSVLGIFTLDLRNSLPLSVVAEEETMQKIEDAIRPYLEN